MNIFNKYPFLIAEISFNFYSIAQKEDISYFETAKLLIEKAKECGFNAVDFHVGDSEYLYCNFEENSSIRSDELSLDDYKKLADYCNEIGIIFIVTPSDFDDVDGLNEYVDAYKVSSSDLTNIPFIKHIAANNKPVILSSAASTLNEVKDAIQAVENESNYRIAVMHSVLSYPTKLEDANLSMIKDLASSFRDYDIGYCDYTIPDKNMFVLTTAFNYGAVILEKYFSLDKSLEGHEFSMNPDDAYVFRLNANVLSKINGYKNKQPLICESFSRKNLRKSIVAKRDIEKGEILKESDLDFKRPGIGISPSEIDNVLGRVVNEDIKKGYLLDYDFLN